jgi:hypothetical protein
MTLPNKSFLRLPMDELKELKRPVNRPKLLQREHLIDRSDAGKYTSLKQLFSNKQ